MGHLKPDYWVDFPLTEDQVKELEQNKQVKVFLLERGHNYPIGTVLKISKNLFAKIENKKPETFLGKNNHRDFGHEYLLVTDKA